MWGPDQDDLACSACGGALMSWDDRCVCGGPATRREFLQPANRAHVRDTEDTPEAAWQRRMAELRRRYVR